MIRLTVHPDATATGYFHPEPAWFMPSRLQAEDTGRPLPAGLFEPGPASGRASDFDLTALQNETFAFLLQARLPRTRLHRFRLEGSKNWTTAFVRDDTEWATFSLDTDHNLTVRQSATGQLADLAERALADWESLRRPGLSDFRLTVTGQHQRFTVPGSGIGWELPA